jgi:hypothetical protein
LLLTMSCPRSPNSSSRPPNHLDTDHPRPGFPRFRSVSSFDSVPSNIKPSINTITQATRPDPRLISNVTYSPQLASASTFSHFNTIIYCFLSPFPHRTHSHKSSTPNRMRWTQYRLKWNGRWTFYSSILFFLHLEEEGGEG